MIIVECNGDGVTIEDMGNKRLAAELFLALSGEASRLRKDADESGDLRDQIRLRDEAQELDRVSLAIHFESGGD